VNPLEAGGAIDMVGHFQEPPVFAGRKNDKDFFESISEIPVFPSSLMSGIGFGASLSSSCSFPTRKA
jgi:hypothetical protein